MKTRLLHTDFWIDDQVGELNVTTKLLYMYLFTNPHIGTTPIYKISNKVISFETGLSTPQIDQGKTKLQEIGKIKFYKDYVYILNADRYNKYHLGKTTSIAYEKEMREIPKEVKEVLLSSKSYTLSEKVDTLRNNKQEIINNKFEDIQETLTEELPNEKKYPIAYLSNIPPEDLEEFIQKFKCNKAQVQSKANSIVDYCKSSRKKYEDYKATLRNWLRRDFGERPQERVQFVPEPIPQLTEEQRQRNAQWAKETRDKLAGKFNMN